MTITDAIEAGVLAAFGSPGQRAVLAARAGMDLLLCAAQDVTQGQAVVSHCKRPTAGSWARPPSTPPSSG